MYMVMGPGFLDGTAQVIYQFIVFDFRFFSVLKSSTTANVLSDVKFFAYRVIESATTQPFQSVVTNYDN